MQRNPHSYQIATDYRTFYSLSLIYQPITKKRLFFHKKYHSQIEKYDNNIRLEPKDIKYGWVIFQIPEILKNRRIERYRIIVQDVENNVSKAESLLIKEIHYDD